MPTKSEDRLQTFVTTRVNGIQIGWLSDSKSQAAAAAATLARLRRGVGRSPGGDPLVWAEVFQKWPDELVGRDDTANAYETAAYCAITLFAVHQQSRRTSRMHKPGPSLGQAVGELSRRSTSADAVRRRFDMIATAQSLDELVTHGRGMVTLLRGQDIPLDYGLLALQLLRFQQPGTRTSVRLRWARDFHRVLNSTGAQPERTDTETAATATTAAPEDQS